jgi:transposase
VIDNLKAVVMQADWYDPDLNPKLRACAAHYGVAILPTRPRTPRHKGKIEQGLNNTLALPRRARLGALFAGPLERAGIVRTAAEKGGEENPHRPSSIVGSTEGR